jgi:hypothetical protein
MTTEERFWEKVTKGPDCWEWTGGRVGDGERPDTRYGRFATSTTRGSVVLVLPHRYSWELHYFPGPPRAWRSVTPATTRRAFDRRTS